MPPMSGEISTTDSRLFLLQELSPGQNRLESEDQLLKSFRSHDYPKSSLEKLYLKQKPLSDSTIMMAVNPPLSRVLESLSVPLLGISLIEGTLRLGDF